LTENPTNIIQACLRNERAAQQQLFNIFNLKLYKSACAYLNNPEIAKEVVQETWIDIFKGLKNYDQSKSKLTTWMHTILIRKIWKTTSQNSRTINIENALHYHSYNDHAIEKMSCEEILNEMNKIPEGSRIVFKMYVLEGFKHKEIATMLNISESTSRAHLTKARKIMKKRYQVINQIIGL